MKTKYVVNPRVEPDEAAVLWRAKKIHAEIITDTVNLEGNPFTLPEIQTLLDGVTVGGHKLDYQQQVLNQSESWKYLLQLVASDTFSMDKKVACALNNIVAREESLAWGCFRDRAVTIAGTDWRPPAANDLVDSFELLRSEVGEIDDIFIQAMTVFLQMARNQYFFDGNKRTARLMMNGILLQAGFDVINIPYKRQQEFNEKMLKFYDTGEMLEMYVFLLSCSITPGEKPQLIV